MKIFGFNITKEREAIADSDAKLRQFTDYIQLNSAGAASPDANMLMDALVAEICDKNNCSNYDRATQGEQRYSVEYLLDNLPGVNTVLAMFVQLVIGKGLTADTEQGKKALQKWLSKKTPTGTTNQQNLNQAVEKSILMGYSGLRKVNSDVLFIDPRQIRIWKAPYFLNGEPVPGIKQELLYQIFDQNKEKIERSNINNKSTIKAGDKRLKPKDAFEKGLFKIGVDGSLYIDDDDNGASTSEVWLDAAHFVHLRHNLDGDYGVSPLSKDKLRLGLVIDIIQNMIDEVNNDGNDYIMWLKDRLAVAPNLSAAMNPMMADSSAKAAMNDKTLATSEEKRLESAKRLAQQMKRSSKTRFSVVSKNNVDAIDRLPGTVRLFDYYPIVDNAITIVANAFGLHPILAGSTSSGWNTSMSSVMQFTLEKIIAPYQKLYSAQVADMVKTCAGITTDVHFEEYDLGDAQTIAQIDKIISETKLNIAKEQDLLSSLSKKSGGENNG